MNTISAQRALKARISAGWSHDSSHFHFERTSRPEHRHIPFVEDLPPRQDVAGMIVLVAIVAALATAPWWVEFIPRGL